MSGVSICASHNIDVIVMKFDSKLSFDDYVLGIICHTSQRIGMLRLAVNLCDHLHVSFFAIMHLFP